MKKTQPDHPVSIKDKSMYSKAFAQSINNLFDEIQLAFQWHRPSILLAIHNTTGGQLIAQQFLEKKLLKEKYVIQHITPQKDSPDVINTIRSFAEHKRTVFFVSGLENANQLSQGNVYQGLNLHREHLVEQKICAVFWLTELEASRLPRFAPDFWAFRHRVIEFAPQRGPRNPTVPSGLFLWKDQLPWMDLNSQKKQIADLEDFLSKLPNEESTLTARLDSTLKLLHLHWQLHHTEKFSAHFDQMLSLLKTHTNFQYHSWTLNAKGIKLFEDGEKSSAQACFEQALDIEPNNSVFMINSAIVAHGTGKNREAILLATKAIKNDPTHPQLWHILGLLHLSMGKPQNAVEALQQALERQPDNLNMLYSLAIAHSKNNQPEACSLLLVKIENNGRPQNTLESACQKILTDHIEEALTSLRQALDSSMIHPHQLLQDPNLCALLDPQNLMSLAN
jgi:tetratricopeptide (TPR) repeat protein